MPRFDFSWYDENTRHLSEHGVTPEEFEEVVMSARFVDVRRGGADMVRGKPRRDDGSSASWNVLTTSPSCR
jgi:hypothetical protein